jgi:hypothetical protein
MLPVSLENFLEGGIMNGEPDEFVFYFEGHIGSPGKKEHISGRSLQHFIIAGNA